MLWGLQLASYEPELFLVNPSVRTLTEPGPLPSSPKGSPRPPELRHPCSTPTSKAATADAATNARQSNLMPEPPV
jgi:hypothetical protein